MITYVRRNHHLRNVERRQDQLGTAITTPDILLLQIKPDENSEPIYLGKIYNASPGCEGAGETAEKLIKVAGLMQKHTIVVGDFNLHHMDWDNHTINPNRSAICLLEWVANNAVTYGLSSGTITHNRGGTLGLTICSAFINQ